MNDIVYSISEIKSIVEPVAREYGVEAMYLFGSYAKGNANARSDVDLRVDRGDARGIRFGGLLIDLEEALEKRVDLLTTSSLDEAFIQLIANEEIRVY